MVAETTRILLLEDCPLFAESVRLILSDRYEVQLAGTVAEAIDLARRQHFDLYITDLTLPDGSGHLLCSFLRSQPSSLHTPIVIMTGADRKDALALEFERIEFLAKPFDADHLCQRVQELLKMGRQSA